MSVLANQAYGTIVNADTLTRVELEHLIGRGGRDSGPRLLATAYAENKICDTVVAELVGGVWSMADYPDRELSRDEWRMLFDAAGFTIDGQPSDRPPQPLTLARGSVPERRADWSWTRSMDVAWKYAAGGLPGRAPGTIWICEVPPEAMLAINTERGEDEVVVDTRGLSIREVQW